MALFTVIADHEDGASFFSQVRAQSGVQAIVNWVKTLEGIPWEHFSRGHSEQILDQMDKDVLIEEGAIAIKGCQFLWRQDFVLYPEEKHLRVVVVKTYES